MVAHLLLNTNVKLQITHKVHVRVGVVRNCVTLYDDNPLAIVIGIFPGRQ